MQTITERNTKAAMLNGFCKTCPNCGRGRLLNGYLTVAETCESCGQDLTHQRADDGPAYLTIVIVGHVLVPLLVPAYRLWDVPPAVMAGGFSIAAIALSMILLPRLKGALIGFQWAKRMHGF
jgi:uncharacterized protein (DUF983 family)